VGLAAYAAAAISGADPVKTGVQGFKYEIRTALLPFIFIFNGGLLMIGITGPLDFVMVMVTSVLAMVAFVAATQGWFLTRNRWWETLALLLICFTLFRPGYWLDQFYNPFVTVAPTQLMQSVDQTPPGDALHLRVNSLNARGDPVQKLIRITLGPGKTASQRLVDAGLRLNALGNSVTVASVSLGSQPAKFGLQFGDEITAVLMPADRPSRYWFTIPGFLLLGLVFWLQRRRKARDAGRANAPVAAGA
jgi:hypothetical protein